MSFAFVPRKFAKPVKPPPPKVPNPSLHASTTTNSPHADVKGKGKLPEPNDLKVTEKDKEKEKEKKPKFTDETLTSLILLALSDYAIWSDSDLRRRVDPSSDDGYVPLTYILHHSLHLRRLPLSDPQTQAQIIKSLRAHAEGLIEIRLRLVSQPSSSAWSGKGPQGKTGGYEIRRCDWESYELPSSTYTKAEWDKRTVYFENIPPTHRTIPGILTFTTSLLPSPSRILTSIQNIHLPEHYKAAPGDAPACKGFAFITFSSLEDAQRMIDEWPWDSTTPALDEEEDEDEEKKEARKFGFRAVSKKRWDELKEEYFAYREQLVAEINELQDSSAEYAPIPTHQTSAQPEPNSTPEPNLLNPNAPYPPNVLLFIKHLHSGTNKTTLRKLFSSAFKPAIERGEVESDGLDYVDYTKGMDSCHLRLVTPTHARILLEHFTSHPTVQSSGLDEVGAEASGENEKIEVELVQGKREEVYWEKVPERVRWAAVEKGIALQQSQSKPAAKRKRPADEDEHPASDHMTVDQQRTTMNSPYPYDCLLFVKHIHPETNKTTLRKLFSRAFESAVDGLDYVDFNKGMDSCYLRLATPFHATSLVSYFQEHSVFQTSGLDDTGSETGGNGEKAIEVEMVQGKREEVYWEKVPEKVRWAAVGKAVATAASSSAPAANAAVDAEGGEEDGRGKKKRRKKKGE